MSLCRKLCVVCATLVLFAIGAVARADNWQIGRGIADITGPAVGIKMLGYVRPEQISAGIHLRQYSRAFVIARGERRVAIVTTDLQSVTHSLVLSVLDELKKKFDHAYQLDNVVIAATHTHAVPSGYWHYGADTPIGSPFNREHFEALVKGIAASIEAADRDLAPGRMFVARGDVENAGAQRSRTAYMQNPEMERSRYSADIDTAMTLLRFERDGRTIGFINWHAVHPTSMSYHNRLISSDNKGCAAYLCERARREQGDAGFVAAFAQSNCGDVTPNLTLDQRGPGSDEFASTRIIAERQCQAAEKLCENATEEISGSLDYRQSYVDFARLTVRDAITGCGDRQTCAAAYGYSFAAGSTEDGGGQPMFKEGMLQPDRLIEAMEAPVLAGPGSVSHAAAVGKARLAAVESSAAQTGRVRGGISGRRAAARRGHRAWRRGCRRPSSPPAAARTGHRLVPGARRGPGDQRHLDVPARRRPAVVLPLRDGPPQRVRLQHAQHAPRRGGAARRGRGRVVLPCAGGRRVGGRRG